MWVVLAGHKGNILYGSYWLVIKEIYYVGRSGWS
jgi:hypothetical protein